MVNFKLCVFYQNKNKFLKKKKKPCIRLGAYRNREDCLASQVIVPLLPGILDGDTSQRFLHIAGFHSRVEITWKVKAERSLTWCLP